MVNPVNVIVPAPVADNPVNFLCAVYIKSVSDLALGLGRVNRL